MFTGIVQAKGKVAAIEREAQGARLVIDRTGWEVEPALGDSICVSGVCLTVVEASPTTLAFDVVAETLSKTTLGRLAKGQAVNLEASVTPTQPLGGHFMQGHVDGVGTVRQITGDDGESRMTIEPPASLLDVIVPKGSIAVDGVSLTIAALTETTFDVALIPTTLRLTTLGELHPGEPVNLEGDILAKTVVHYLQRMQRDKTDGAAITMQTLRQAGFA